MEVTAGHLQTGTIRLRLFLKFETSYLGSWVYGQALLFAANLNCNPINLRLHDCNLAPDHAFLVSERIAPEHIESNASMSAGLLGRNGNGA
jgi:hypothetical protein